MTILNFTHPTLHTTPRIPSNDTGAQSNKPLSAWQWLPVASLVAAIAASALFGAHNSPKQEMNLLNQLAQQGDADAQMELGLAYRDGLYDLKPDATTGLYWLKKAAAGGNAYAEDAIGNALATGNGTTKDIAKAETWWRKSIADGDSDARLHLADALVQTGHVNEANRLFDTDSSKDAPVAIQFY